MIDCISSPALLCPPGASETRGATQYFAILIYLDGIISTTLIHNNDVTIDSIPKEPA
jgi:hypothetical protein